MDNNTTNEDLPLEAEINELLELAKKGEEVEKKFADLVRQLEQPIMSVRYPTLKPIFMDDIHDAVHASMDLLQSRGIIDLKDHSTREIHDTLAMILSEAFGDPDYRSHSTQTTQIKRDDNVNEREGI